MKISSLCGFLVPFALLVQVMPSGAEVILSGGNATVNLSADYAGQSLFLLPSGQIITAGGSGVVGDDSQNWLFTNRGEINAGNASPGSALELGALDAGAAVVVNYSRLSSAWNGGNGPSGVRFTNGGQVFNRAGGYIEGYDGIHSDHGPLVVENAGTIHGRSGGGTAIYSGQGLQVTNLAGGLISGSHYGISANSWERNALIYNYGVLNTSDQAIKLYDGETYAVYNAPDALITSGGGSTIDLEGSTGYLLNEGRIEAQNTAIYVKNLGGENVYVNAGSVVAGNYGLLTRDSGNTIYNLGTVTGSSGAIRIEGDDTRLVLGQSAYLPQIKRTVTGPGSNLDGGAASVGLRNTIILTNDGFEDDPLTGFQGLTTNGGFWELAHDLTVSEFLTVERGLLRMAADLSVSDAGGRILVNKGGRLALAGTATAENISADRGSTLIFEAQLQNDVLTSDSFFNGKNISLSGRLLAEVTMSGNNSQGQTSAAVVVGQAAQNLDLTGAVLSGHRLLYEYRFFADGDALKLQITPQLFNFAPLGGPPNTQSMDAALDAALRDGTLPASGALRDLLEDAAASGSRAEALQVLNPANGTVLAFGPELARQAARSMRDWSLGLSESSCARERGDTPWRFHFAGGGTWGRQSGPSGDAGYDLAAGQIGVAVDRCTGQALAGAALVLNHGRLDWTSGAQSSANSLSGAVYARLDSGFWSLNASAYLGRSAIKSLRSPSPGLTARAEYAANWAGLSVSGAYNWTSGAWEVTPRLSAHYLHLRTPNINETGADDLSLSLAANHGNSLELEASLKLARPFALSAITLRPYLDLGLSVETLDKSRSYLTEFIGAYGVPSFKSESPQDGGRLSCSLAAGLEIRISERISGYIDYRGRFWAHQQEHQGSLSLRVSW